MSLGLLAGTFSASQPCTEAHLRRLCPALAPSLDGMSGVDTSRARLTPPSSHEAAREIDLKLLEELTNVRVLTRSIVRETVND